MRGLLTRGKRVLAPAVKVRTVLRTCHRLRLDKRAWTWQSV